MIHTSNVGAKIRFQPIASRPITEGEPPVVHFQGRPFAPQSVGELGATRVGPKVVLDRLSFAVEQVTLVDELRGHTLRSGVTVRLKSGSHVFPRTKPHVYTDHLLVGPHYRLEVMRQPDNTLGYRLDAHGYIKGGSDAQCYLDAGKFSSIVATGLAGIRVREIDTNDLFILSCVPGQNIVYTDAALEFCKESALFASTHIPAAVTNPYDVKAATSGNTLLISDSGQVFATIINLKITQPSGDSSMMHHTDFRTWLVGK